MNENDLVKLIGNIEFPSTNNRNEKTSADGYALLGCAREMLDLDSDSCLEKMVDCGFSINEDKKIAKDKVIVPAKTFYVYTAWTCMNYFYEKNSFEFRKWDLLGKFYSMPIYPNGFIAYCDYEDNYIVPNVTGSAAWICAAVGDLEGAEKFVELLRKNQLDNGNWEYLSSDGDKAGRQEDSFHLALIVHQLREVEWLTEIETKDVVLRAVSCLNRMNCDSIQRGSLGWGIPALFIATKGLDDELSHRAEKLLFQYSFYNKNFRVRAYAAWAATRVGKYIEEFVDGS